ncbi:MAG TPA: wax ester/triacylglycerol synthase family O-acyltransferase [Deltaproteobacteria bacterium]|nr:wax ester/triacylglycerol synthase family O-acyltransferase [Deltaproteobacteria bacterium]
MGASGAKQDEVTGRDPGAAPLDWARSREMNGIEALMWRAEADPRMRSTICSLAVLDQMPDWDRFVAACDWGSRMAPRFRQKVVEPAFGIGVPCWVNDPDFDLHYHVRRIRLTEGGGWREVFEAAEQIAMTPFDRARSPWEAVLIEGLPEGRAGLLVKLHHSTTDGLGGFQLFAKLHSRTREHDPDKPQPEAPTPEWISPTDLLVEQLSRDARSAPAGLARGLEGVVHAVTRPGQTIRDVTRFVESLRRIAANPDVEGSPLLYKRSLSWHFMALDVVFADLRAAAKAVGATINDVYLASLLGAFRMYHAKLGYSIKEMPVAIPISVRREGDEEGGNKFAGARFAGPVGIADPGKRVAAIGEIIRSLRAEPALDGLTLLAPALARLPAPLLGSLASGLTASNDLQASNVPGFRETLYIAGARIERLYGFGPLPGCATMVTLLTHGEMCCIGVNVDLAAVTDPDLFGECLAAGFAEVLALHEGAAPPVLLV